MPKECPSCVFDSRYPLQAFEYHVPAQGAPTTLFSVKAFLNEGEEKPGKGAHHDGKHRIGQDRPAHAGGPADDENGQRGDGSVFLSGGQAHDIAFNLCDFLSHCDIRISRHLRQHIGIGGRRAKDHAAGQRL